MCCASVLGSGGYRLPISCLSINYSPFQRAPWEDRGCELLDVKRDAATNLLKHLATWQQTNNAHNPVEAGVRGPLDD